MQGVLADEMLKVAKERMRVIQADVGGGFGMKIFVFPEYPACLLAARVSAGRSLDRLARRELPQPTRMDGII